MDANTRQEFNITMTDRHHITAPIQYLIIVTNAGETLQAVRDIALILANDVVILLLQDSQETVHSRLEGYNVWADTPTAGAWKNRRIQHIQADESFIIPATDRSGLAL